MNTEPHTSCSTANEDTSVHVVIPILLILWFLEHRISYAKSLK